MTTIATHPVAPEEIMALLDGELAPEQAALVSAHLDDCPNCTALASDLRGLSQTMQTWTVPALPEPLAQAVAQTIDSQPAPKPAAASKLRQLLNWKVYTVTGLAATAMLIFVVAIPRRESPQHLMSYMATEPLRRQFEGVVAPPPPPPKSAAYADDYAYGGGGPLTDRVTSVAELEPVPAAPTEAKMRVQPQPAVPMISRTVMLTLSVASIEKTRASLDAILIHRLGYAADLTEKTTSDLRMLTASLRIPATQLDAALAELKTLGHVKEEELKGEDVSQQHADLVARLKNSRETELRLRDILEHHTGKMDDILSVEQEISRVRGEIEGMESEQQGLEHRVTYATIELTAFDESVPKTVVETRSVRLHHALTAGWHNATSTVFGMVLFVAEEGPAILIWLILLAVPGYLLWRRYRRIHGRL